MVYPVVPKDVILLRLIPTAIHSEADVAHTLNAFTDVKDIAKTAPALAQWQSVTLANMKAAPNPATQAIKLTGLPTGAVLVKATGLRPNGQAVSSQAAYFVQGTQVFQAVMYADKIAPDVAETFLSGLKFE